MTMAELTEENREGILAIFQSRLDAKASPGSYFAVFSPRGIEFERGLGVAALGGAAPTGSTAFRIASCSKSFTAATLLLLRDRGQVNLDAPVTDFVPRFTQIMGGLPSAVPTVRMLLTMSAGLPTDDPWGDRQESISTDQLRGMLGDGIRFISTPGTAYEYSNLGYAILGLVIEAVAGRGFIEVVTEELLRPLGLDVRYDRHGIEDAACARGYELRGDEWLELPFSEPGAFSPIGGIFATPHQLAGWASWLCGALESEDADPGVLSAASRREMRQIHRAIPAQDPAAPGPARGYGFGLAVEQRSALHRIVSHSGGYPGFSSHMRWHEQSGWGIVAFENATYAGVSVPAAEALRLVLDQVAASRVPEPWPETAELARRVSALLRRWGAGAEAETADIFAENVALDLPFPERRAALERILSEIGALTPESRVGEPELSGESADPAQLSWVLPAERGGLRCVILVTPTAVPRVQTLHLSAEPAS